MSESHKNVYKLSERYISKLHKDIILNMIIIAVFYAVFNVMFSQNEGYREWIRPGLLFLFVLIAVLVVYSDILRIRKYDSVYYKVMTNCLEFCDGKKTVQYPWVHFRAVVMDKNKISLTFPYRFDTEEGSFYLHRQLGEPEELIPAIISQVRPYAEIDPEIPDVFQAKDSLSSMVRNIY